MMDLQWKLIAKITAPAKIILCGQHAVVYGQDAISMAINLKCQALVYQSNSNASELLIEIQQEQKWYRYRFDEKILPLFSQFGQQFVSFEKFQQILSQSQQFHQITQFYDFVFQYKVTLFLLKFNQGTVLSKSMKMIITSQIPIGKCLGSSASFNTVFAAALLIIFQGKYEEKSIINYISFSFEKVQHGNPSGIDNYVTVYGGLILFNKNSQPKFRRLEEVYSHKIKENLFIGIADSGVSKNTKVAVTKVREKYESEEKYRHLIKSIGNISKQCLQIIKSNNKDWKLLLFQKLSLNHSYLRQFGISNEPIQQVVSKYTQEGVSCSKITGSGMGGCVLIVGDKNHQISDPQLILTQIDEAGVIVSLFNQN